MTSMDDVRAAGWYQDPLNAAHSRWWDGREWTQLTQNAGPDTMVIPTAAVTPVPPGSPGAGWFADPGNPHFQRYWDGVAWTQHVAPASPGYPGGTTVIVNGQPPKSVGLAFLLTFLFGPLGVFYSSVTGGLVMTLGGFFGGLLFGLVTFGLGLFVWAPMIWIGSMVWGCVAAGSAGSHTTVIR